MAEFATQAELDKHKRSYGIVTSGDRALLIDPVRHTIAGQYDEYDKPIKTEPSISSVPADQVQHYLDKGFRWPEPVPEPPPVPEPTPEPAPAPPKSRKRRRK